MLKLSTTPWSGMPPLTTGKLTQGGNDLDRESGASRTPPALSRQGRQAVPYPDENFDSVHFDLLPA